MHVAEVFPEYRGGSFTSGSVTGLGSICFVSVATRHQSQVMPAPTGDAANSRKIELVKVHE